MPDKKAKIWQILSKFMDEATKQLTDLYGLNPNIPHRALQFPRLPPGLTHPMFKTFENPLKSKFSQEAQTMNSKLQGFQQMYQKYASGLLEMNPVGVVPPGHPIYNRQNSIEIIKSENQKLQKENLELKKQLDKIKEKSDKHN